MRYGFMPRFKSLVSLQLIFFFQAEDGIRYYKVTGVQTCALPICTSFETGEQLFLSTTVSRASYLSCFMAGADGEVTRLVPNDVNRSGWITAAQSVRLPDWMSPNPGYVINAGPPGKEGVACFATEQNMTDKLPTLLQGK